MLSEVLLILAGHPSSLIEAVAPDGSPSLEGADVGALTSDAEMLAALSATARVRDDVPLRAGERAQLESLAVMAYHQRFVRRFAQVQIERARTQVLRRASSRSASGARRTDERVTAHLAPLGSAILNALEDYLTRVIELEHKVLNRDARLVASHSFVSLLSLRADLADWQPRISSLLRLVRALLDGPQASASLLGLPTTVDVTRLPTGLGGWTGGLLIDLLSHAADTGVARVAELMASLREAVEHSWTVLLIDWVCHGIASGSPIALGSHLVSSGRDALIQQADSTSLASATTIQGSHDGWTLCTWALPHSIPPALADTILYLGRAIHRVKFFAASDRSTEAGPVPMSLITVHAARLREPGVRPSQPLVFAQVLNELQQEVGEWLWRTVLTNEAVVASLEDLGNFFLLRNGTFTRSLLSELERTRQDKRLYARTASLAALHEADLETALHRASVGAELEDHPSFERLHWRPVQTSADTKEGDADQSVLARLGLADTAAKVETLVEKCTLLAGLPPGYRLSYTAEFPLDLFLSSTELVSYSHMFSYLFALCHTQRRVVGCWTSLSNSQRVRRKFTGTGEGGVDSKEVKRRTNLLRMTWSLARDLIWFLDTLMGHFQTDVIEVQYGNLLGQLYQAHEQRQDRREKRLSNASSNAGSPSRALSIPSTQRRSPRKHTLSSPTKQRDVGSPLKDRLMLPDDNYSDDEVPTRLPFPSAVKRNTAAQSLAHGHSDLDVHRRDRAHSTPATDRRAARPASTLGPSVSPRKTKPSFGARSAAASAWASAPRAGTEPAQLPRLDFADVRTLHLTFLAYLQEGLLLSSPQLAGLVQQMVSHCERFAGLIDRWGGDVLPDLLSEGSLTDDRTNDKESAVLDERYRSIAMLAMEVRDHLCDFFEIVSEGPGQLPPQDPAQLGKGSKNAVGGAGIAGGGTLGAGQVEQLRLEMGAAARQHLTQLAARLDFNGFFTGTNLRHYEEAQRARAAQAAIKAGRG